MALTKTPVFHGRSKPIDIKYHYIQDMLKEKEILIVYSRSEDQMADILTKLLKADLFVRKKMLSMTIYEELGLREAIGNSKPTSK